MTNAMRAEAAASRDDKMRRMGILDTKPGIKVTTADRGDEIDGHQVGPAADGTAGYAHVGYADDFRKGDKAVARKAPTRDPVNGEKGSKRLDRPGYARGGAVKAKPKGTTVNVVIAPQGSSSPAMPAMPPGAGVPPVAPPPGAPPMAPPGVLGRKHGGRVTYAAGAGSGEGREQKIRAYGRKARSG